MKKRVAEQTEEIKTLEQGKTRLTEKTQTALRIQQEFDIAQDEIDRLKKSESALNKDLKAALDAHVKLKEADFEKTNQIQVTIIFNILSVYFNILYLPLILIYL